MDIEGKNALVFGGAGLVGLAVCRELLRHRAAVLIVASRQRSRANSAADQLRAEFDDGRTRITPVWGDVFIRAGWQRDDTHPREAALADRAKRRRLIADILDPLDEEIVETSMLAQIIQGTASGMKGVRPQLIVDCMNTATALSYQNIFASARSLAKIAQENPDEVISADEVEPLLASLYLPQLVRHVQLLYEAMRRAGTQAYVKVGTTGTGGMGFNVPYTHGEEKPSRLLLAKAALAGAQSALTFLMARTPDGPTIVKEIKPAAVVGWKEIGYGPIHRGGHYFPVCDCAPDQAVSVHDKANLVAHGDFGTQTGEKLEGVYIHTGENGQFAAAEFTALTAIGQMELVTPEEVAQNVLQELLGGNTGRDVIGALDGAVTGPSYRGGYLRQAAINRLHELEVEHGEAVAFEILGPPRLSKLLFEAHLLKRAFGTLGGVLDLEPEALSSALERQVCDAPEIRRQIISIGIPILLSDSERLLRGPVVKSEDAYHGWVDLTPANMETWRRRFVSIWAMIGGERRGDTSSRYDRWLTASSEEHVEDRSFNVGEVVAWIFTWEEQGQRGKN